VVGDVAVGHNEAVITNRNDGAFVKRGVDGDVFAYFAVFSNLNVGGFAAVFVGLGTQTYACAGLDCGAIANGCVSVEVGVGFDCDVVANFDVFFDDSKRFDCNVFTDFCPLFNNGVGICH